MVSGQWKTRLVYQLQLRDGWLRATVSLNNIADEKPVFMFHIDPLSKSRQELNAFALSGKTFIHYIMLLFLILIPAFIIYTMVLCVRMKMKITKKLLWIICMSFGVLEISLCWTTGNIFFIPRSITFFGVSFSKAPYAPWFISVSLPLGALLFYVERHKIKGTGIVNSSEFKEAREKKHEA